MASKMFLFIFGLFWILCSMDLVATVDTANDENKMGMEALYEMVHFFLGDIVQPKNITDSFLNLSTVFVHDELDKDQLEDWKEWMDYAKGYAAGVVAGLLFIVAMPIVGLIFCLCRVCCGNCGGKPRKHDTRRSKCKRRTYCTLIVIFNTLALAGVVCAFMCSHLIHTALKNDDNEGTVGHIRESLTNIKNFTDQAVTNVSSIVWTVFDKTAEDAITNINETSSSAVDSVLNSLNATRHLDKAKEISRNVTTTKGLLDEIATTLGELTDKSRALRDNLTAIRDDIRTICGSAECSGFKASDYDTDADFSRLDKLQDQASNVSKSLNMSQYIDQAEENIEKAKRDTRDSIKDKITEATDSIEEIRGNIQVGIDDLTTQKNDAMDFYPSTMEDLKDLDDKVKDNSDTIFYVCIGVSCVYLLIVALYYFGIVFGLCGERPGHDAPCCNRGTGASFLMAGVSLTFIFSWILMFLCTILFITGGISYTEVCRYFHGHDPSNFKFFDDTLNNGFDLSKTLYKKNSNVKFSLSQSLRDCQANKALYSAFKMDNIVDLDETINTKPLQDKLKELQNSNLNINDITILNDDLKKKLEDFADAGINNVNFTDYYVELNKNLTKVSLLELSDVVKNYAGQIPDTTKEQKLLTQANKLEELHNGVVKELQEDKKNLKVKLEKLEKDSDVSEPIKNLITALKKSEDEFNNNKDTLVQQEIDKVADLILGQTNNSVDDLKKTIRTNVANCQPLSTSLYSVSDSVCVLLVDPLNGLWFSFGWCLFFFVLCLIFGVLLAGEYRHEYKYGKEFDDPYDGRNHDMMPLTSHPNPDRGHYPGHHSTGYQQQHEPYQQPTGLHNNAYSPEIKPRNSNAPPPYRQHMQPGEWSVEGSPYATKSSQMFDEH